MSEKPYTRRIAVNVPELLYQRIDSLFEWGERNRVLCRLLEWMCEKVEKHGKQALFLLLREEDLNTLLSLEKSDGDNR